jgi:hypothetical protein
VHCGTGITMGQVRTANWDKHALTCELWLSCIDKLPSSPKIRLFCGAFW